jgi:His-Xaa-Ser system radical SAM maturase HxsC
MMALHGRVVPHNMASALPADVWRIAEGPEHDSRVPAARLVGSTDTGEGRRLSLHPSHAPGAGGASVVLDLPPSLNHISDGDVVAISPDGTRMTVLWKASAQHNSLLLTERCDNYCIMCSQPPKVREDNWLYDRAIRVIDLLPASTLEVGLTGGEPTVNQDALLRVLSRLRSVLPETQVHLLSNGRAFSKPEFARRYAAVDHPGLMVGIPLYGPESSLHDFIVQSVGAFDETIRGILNLATLGQRVELRVVIQRHNVAVLASLADFVARNLPFVEQVALMGLEMTGFARSNADEVWIDPVSYQGELREATGILIDSRIRVRIYNHQLCVLDRALWPVAVRSISDWKAGYIDTCQTCAVIETCGGVFTTSGARVSKHLHALSRS